MTTAEIFYGNPVAAYLFFIVPILFLLFYFLDWHRQRVLKILGDKKTLSKVLYRRPRFNFWRKSFLVMVVWILSTIALMDPKGNPRYPDAIKEMNTTDQEETQLKRKAHEIIFLLDISSSMDVADMRGGRKRLEIAKELVDETIRQLDGESVSLYVFTSESDKYVPSTMDHIFARLILRDVEINEEGTTGTDIYRSLKEVLRDHPANPNEKLKTLILLSDGEDIEYGDDSTEERAILENNFIELIGNPKQKNLRIITIGLGTEKGGEVPLVLFMGDKVESHLDPTLLKVLSKAGDGEYYNANDHDIITLSSKIVENINRGSNFLMQYEAQSQSYLDQSGEHFIYDLHYQRPLFIAAFILGLVILSPENWRRSRR